MTWRRLLVLVHHLPPESAVHTAVRNEMPDNTMARRGAAKDPAMGSWSSVEGLLATLIDEVRQQTWVYIQSHTERKIPRPAPMRRPGLSERPARTLSLADAQRLDPRLRDLSEEDAQAMLDRLTGGSR